MNKSLLALTLLTSQLFTAQAANPAERQPYTAIWAAAQIFNAEHHLNGTININDKANPPWSEARIKSADVDVFVAARDGSPCTFDIGRTEYEASAPDGLETVSMGKVITSISFDRLGPAYEVTPSPAGFGYVYLIIYGEARAVYESRYGWRDRLFMAVNPAIARNVLVWFQTVQTLCHGGS
jgi:hypothetical protein